MSHRRNSRAVAASLALAALLATTGCGGGGGGGASAPATSSVSVSGVASKGLVKHGVARAYGVTDAGLKGDLLGSAETGDDGSYTITGLPPSVVILIEITPKADGSTRVADEATGTDIVPTADFKIRGATRLEASGAVTLQITPFSDMATALAEQQPGGFKADTVQAANDKVVAFVGEAVLTQKPTFDGDGKPTNAVGVKLAAVSRLASTGAYGCQGTQSVKVDCVVQKLSQKGPSDRGLSDDIDRASDDARTASGYQGPLAGTTAQTGTLVSTEAKTAIQQAKALIQSVRNVGVALSGQGDQDLVPRLQAIKVAARSTMAPLDMALRTEIAGVASLLPVLDDPARYGVLPGDTGFSKEVMGAQGAYCTFYSDSALTNVAIANDLPRYMTCRVTVAQMPAVGNTAPYAVQYEFQASALEGPRQYGLNSRLIRQSQSLQVSSLRPSNMFDSVTPDSAFQMATVTLPVKAGAFVGAAIVGDLAPGRNAAGQAKGAKASVDLSVTGTDLEGGLLRMGLRGALTNVAADGTTAQSVLSVRDGSYLQGDPVSPNPITLALHLDLGVTLVDGGQIDGVLDLTGPAANTDLSVAGDVSLSFLGTITEASGTALFKGLVSISAPTDASLLAEARLKVTVPVPSLESTMDLDFTLNGVLSGPSSGEVTVSGRYTQGSNVILLTAVKSATEPKRSVTVSTLSGVTFTALPGDRVVLVYRGEVLMARFNTDQARLVYSDGSFEQY